MSICQLKCVLRFFEDVFLQLKLRELLVDLGKSLGPLLVLTHSKLERVDSIEFVSLNFEAQNSAGHFGNAAGRHVWIRCLAKGVLGTVALNKQQALDSLHFWT